MNETAREPGGEVAAGRRPGRGRRGHSGPEARAPAASGMTEERADLAVVIVSYNTAGHLDTCLSSLRSGGLEGATASIWVVDNGSGDGTVDLVRQRYPEVRLIDGGGNIGYAAANNLALRSAGFEAGRGPWAPLARHALLLNPDTVIPAGSLARLLGFLLEDGSIGVVGPKLVRPDGSLDPACRRSFPTPEVSLYRFSGLARLFPSSRRFGRYNVSYLDPDLPTDVDSVVGACMLVRGDVIRQSGLLDERFWMYGEDLDWALRIRRLGWRVVYRPQVMIQHAKRAASAGSDRARYEFVRAMWLFYEKHYASSTGWPLHWLVLSALAVRGGPRLVREMRRGPSAL